jgi:hypothetical protein
VSPLRNLGKRITRRGKRLGLFREDREDIGVLCERAGFGPRPESGGAIQIKNLIRPVISFDPNPINNSSLWRYLLVFYFFRRRVRRAYSIKNGK